MSTDRPVPPSIQPREHAARPEPRAAAAEAPVQPPEPAPAKVGPPAPAPRPEAAVTPAPTTTVSEAMKRTLKGATTAVVGVKAALTGAPTRGEPLPTPAGYPQRTDSTKADPTIAATDTRATKTPPGAARPAPARMPAPSSAREGAPRRVRLSVSRVDPWSVMKLSFLLSVAIGIMIVVAAAVVWFVLDGFAVFTRVNDMITEIVGTESPVDVLQYVEFSRIVSGATVVAVVDVILLTALSTIGAFLYNITAALVGGVTLTLTDD